MKQKNQKPKKDKTEDPRFKRYAEIINGDVYKTLSERGICLRPRDICKHGKITRPTFYAHCTDSTDALHKHEANLEQDFYKRLPKHRVHNEVVFTILLVFIREYDGYFSATISTSNFYLLRTIFNKLKPIIASKNIDKKSYDMYVLQQIGLISCWASYDNYSNRKIALYAKKMQSLRIMNFGI